MRLQRILIASLLAVLCSTVNAQPLFETRAVWLTTAGGSDWPGGLDDPEAQEARLREIIRNARLRGLNTVFFQVVPRGDAFYRSERLPWSPLLAGAVGADPGYDPLWVATETAHANGMELHAWINTYRIANMSTGSRTPDHVSEAHPEWVENKSDGATWLNPGIPEVNQWIVDNVIEVVEKYDLDAVHFDFARYAQGAYRRDDSLFVANNPTAIAIKDDWRRENVNNLMRAIQSAVSAIKPWIKIGSTPIGNYDTACYPSVLSGFNDVFQDSRLWLSEGLNDYLAPQFYWADSNPNSPSFTCLVKDWVAANTSRRHLYPGVALYQQDVVDELASQIDATRSEGAQGVSFFREFHTHGKDFGGRFDALSLPPPIAQRFEATAPETPESLSVTVDGPRQIHIEWMPSAGAEADPVGWYAIFRRSQSAPDVADARDLTAVVFRDRISYDDVLPDDEIGPVLYSVVAISRLGFLAEPTEAVSTGQLPVAVEDDVPTASFRLESIYPNPASDRISISFTSDGARTISLRVVDALGREVIRRSIRATTGQRTETLATGSLPAGLYLAELSSGDKRARAAFVVAR